MYQSTIGDSVFSMESITPTNVGDSKNIKISGNIHLLKRFL